MKLRVNKRAAFPWVWKWPFVLQVYLNIDGVKPIGDVLIRKGQGKFSRSGEVKPQKSGLKAKLTAGFYRRK